MSRSSVALIRPPREPLGDETSHTVDAPRVLIVEDERIVAADLQRLLRKLGYDAFACAASASRALALASQTAPDVVLADIRIEGPVDGIDTAFELHREYGAAVVFLTAHADDPTLERAKQAEPCGYLIKPVSAPALKSAIEIALHRREQEAAGRAVELALAQVGATLVSALDHLPLAVQLEDAQRRLVHVNSQFRLLFGIDADRGDLMGTDAATLVRHIRSLCADGSRFDAIEKGLRQSQRPIGGNVITLQDGRKLEVGYAPLFQSSRREGQLWTYRDITVSERAREELEQSAARHRQETLVDSLTGLTNRRGFFQLAETYRKLTRCAGEHSRILFFIDLDGLKRINDQQGHAAGDAAIVAVAHTLRGAFRAGDLLARLGGDEFVVLAEMAPLEVDGVRDRLNEKLKEHGTADGRPYSLAVSVGTAEWMAGESLDSILTRADEAMYRDKRRKQIPETGA